MKAIAPTLAALLFTATAALADDPIRPDPQLTPGAVLAANTATICRPGYAKSVRHTSGKLKAWVYREYGISRAHRAGGGHYEIDHLMPISLGGADVVANLWPESWDTQPWNAQVKDRLRTSCMPRSAPAASRSSRRSKRSRRIGSPLTRSISGSHRRRPPSLGASRLQVSWGAYS